MNHRAKRRAKRAYLRPEVVRHKQREANRAKLHAKLNTVKQRESFIDPPAVDVAPLFPTRIEEATGVKVVEAGRSRIRRSVINTFPNILNPPKNVIAIDVEA